MINKISEEEKKNLEKKFESFDRFRATKKEIVGYIKNDPTLFAYFFFKDNKGNKFKALPWQDKFLNSKSKRRLLCCSRQIGKSTITGILAIYKAYFNPGFTILVVSRTKDQAMEVVYRMKQFMKTSTYDFLWQELRKDKKHENKKEIILRSSEKGAAESRIIVVPATDAALGFSADIVICDEAARWEDGDRVFREDIEPTTSWTEGDIYLLSTPRGRQGFFYEFYNMPDVWEVYEFDYRVNPHNTPEKVKQLKKLHTTASFAMNYLAKFVANENQYFTPEEINSSISSQACLGYKGEEIVSVGVDFGKVNDYCVIDIGTVLSTSNEPVIRLIDRRVKPLGTDYSIVLSELEAINEALKPRIFVLDVTSGEIPSDMLRVRGLPVDPFKFTIPSKIKIMNNLKVLMQQRRLQIPNVKEIVSQLEMFQYSLSKMNQDRMQLHAPKGFHDDEVDALALMAYGLCRYDIAPAFVSIVSRKSPAGDKSRICICPKCEEEGKDSYHKAISDKNFEKILCPLHS